MSAQRDKGTRAETAVVRYLQSCGFLLAERRALRGQDAGDVAGIDGVVIEVKDHKEMRLAAWLREARTEAIAADADIYAVWHKRRGTVYPGDWYVTLDGATFVHLLAQVLEV